MKNKALYRFGFIFLISLIGCIMENIVQAQSSQKNWGIRLGLNTVSITNYEAFQADEILPNCSYTNQNGYLITFFKRFNINRMYLQPELAWNKYRRTCSFSLSLDNGDSYYPPVDLNIYSKAVNTNFLAGYNIVYNYPFLFGVYAGISFIGTYKTDFSMNTEELFSKTGLTLDYSGVLGFSINISKIYFDLRYEMCLPNAKLFLSDIPDLPQNFQNIIIKKTEAILSFSVGVMF